MAAVTVSPPPVQPPRSNFVFINDTNPDDAKSKAKRKLVRAQAARGSHSNPTTTVQGIERSRNAPSTTKHQALKRSKKERASTTFPLNLAGLGELEALPSRAAEKSQRTEDGVVVTVEERSAEEGDAPPFPKPRRRQGLKTSTTSSSTNTFTASTQESALSRRSNSSFITRNPGTGWAAPFISHPDPEKTYIPAIIDHYLRNMATRIPELDVETPFIIRNRWFPMVITSPATMYIVILIAATHYAAFNNLLPNPQIRAILLHLKQQTLSSINTLIRDTPPGEPMSDIIIGAVLKMASYEAMFGTPSLYHTHMRGLKHMVEGRGGLHRLGLDGLMQRMVLWIDINSAFILNCGVYFPTSVPLATYIGIQPNPGGFLCYE